MSLAQENTLLQNWQIKAFACLVSVLCKSVVGSENKYNNFHLSSTFTLIFFNLHDVMKRVGRAKIP